MAGGTPGQWLSTSALGSKVRRKKDRSRGYLAAAKYRKEDVGEGAAAAAALANASAEAAYVETVDAHAQGTPGVPFTPLEPADFKDPDKVKGLTLQWLRSIADTESRFSSTSVWAHCTYMQIERATRDLPSPNLLRTTAACVLLARLCDDIALRQSGMLSEKVKVFQDFKQTPHSPMRASYAAPKQKMQYTFTPMFDTSTEAGGGGASGLSLSNIELHTRTDAVAGDDAASTSILSQSLGTASEADLPARVRVFRNPGCGGARRGGARAAVTPARADDAAAAADDTCSLSASTGAASGPAPTPTPARQARRVAHGDGPVKDGGTLQGVLHRLLDGVFAAVYAGWGGGARDVAVWLRDVAEYQEVFAGVRLFAELRTDEAERSIAAREAMDKELEAVEAARVRKASAVLMEINTWKRAVLSNCFRAWRAETQAVERINEIIERIVRGKQVMLDEFIKWTAFVKLRMHAAKTVSAREQREHEGHLRKWREERSDLQLHTATIKNQLSTCSAQHREEMHTQGMYHRADMERLQRQIDELKATVAARDETVTKLQTELDSTRAERDKWQALASTFAGVEGEQSNIDHPFYPFVTDQPHRSRVQRKLDAKRAQLQEQCDAYAKRTLRSAKLTQEDDARKAQLETLARQAQETGNPEDFAYIGDATNMMEYLQQHQSTERLLLQFCNYIFDTLDVQRASPLENFSSDMQDSEVFIVLLKVVYPKKCTLDPLLETSHHVRASLVVDATYRVGLEGVITEDDILLGRAHKNCIFVAMLFKVYCLEVAVGGVSEDALHWTSEMIQTRRELKGAAPQENNTPDTTRDPEAPSTGADAAHLVKFEESTKILFQARKAWQYMGEYVMKEIVKQLQGGQKEGDVLDGKWNRQLMTNTALDEGRLLDIMVADVNEEDELDECEEILGRFYGDIRAIYNYYSCLEIGPGVSQQAFGQFAQDAGLSPLVGKKVVEVCRIKATMGGNANAITQAELSEFLVRVAFAAFRKSGHSCSRSLTLLLSQHVLPHAMRSNVDMFRKELRSSHCQRVMASAHPLLKRGFQCYASGVQTADGPLTVVTLHDYSKFLKDCGVLDSRFTHADASFVYTASLIDAAPKTASAGVTLKEWFECCACIALFKMPSPLMPTAMKLDVFFNRTIFPRLKNKLKPAQGGV